MATTRRRIGLHYCSCYPKSLRDSERVPAKYYCYRHRRHLCDNCIYDELNQRHLTCYVGTYDSFIQSGPTAFSQYKKNKCPICDEVLPDDDARAVVRLNCTCVYHSKCLQHYLLENTTNDIPCIRCNLAIASTPSTKGSNLDKSVANFLRSVTRQRLWNKPKAKAVHSVQLTEEKIQRSQSLLAEHSGQESTPLISSSIDRNVARCEDTTQYPKRKIKPRPKTLPKSPTSQRKAPVHAGHIVVDTRDTRHRKTAHSMNPDGNVDDDKYHKKKRFVPSYVPKRGHVQSWLSRVGQKRALVLLLLCCALVVQCYFVWILFIKDNTDDAGSSQDDVVQQLFPEKAAPLDDLLGNQAKVKALRDRVMQ